MIISPMTHPRREQFILSTPQGDGIDVPFHRTQLIVGDELTWNSTKRQHTHVFIYVTANKKLLASVDVKEVRVSSSPIPPILACLRSVSAPGRSTSPPNRPPAVASHHTARDLSTPIPLLVGEEHSLAALAARVAEARPRGQQGGGEEDEEGEEGEDGARGGAAHRRVRTRTTRTRPAYRAIDTSGTRGQAGRTGPRTRTPRPAATTTRSAGR